jgi:predicted PurR-regulated permease PerM
MWLVPAATMQRVSDEPRRVVTVANLFQAGVGVVGVVALVWLLWTLLHVVLLVLTAIILAEGLRPGVRVLSTHRVPFGLAIAAAYLALVAAVLGLVALVAGPAVTELVTLTSYEPAIARNVDQLLNTFKISSDQLTSGAGVLLGAAGGVVSSVIRVGGSLVGILGDLLTVFLLSITWMAATRDLKGFVVGLFDVRRRAFVAELIAETSRAFAGYVRGVGINMLAIGTLALVACWALRLPAPVLLAVFAGLCELIPLVGPFLGAVPAVLLGFTISPVYPLLVAGAFLVLQQVESNVLTPVVMRHEVGIRPFVVILALLSGAALAGIWGALVAVPLASAIQIVVVRVVAPAIRGQEPAAAGRQEPAAVTPPGET